MAEEGKRENARVPRRQEAEQEGWARREEEEEEVRRVSRPLYNGSARLPVQECRVRSFSRRV